MAQHAEDEKPPGWGPPSPYEVDQYLGDEATAPHLSPKLLIEKNICPSLTIWVQLDGKRAWIQRWYDVREDVLDGTGSRSFDFVPDSTVRLVDKDGREIHRVHAKLTDDFDELPFVLARIEKAWRRAHSCGEFWEKITNYLIRVPIPEIEEVGPEIPIVRRTGWIELCCFWIGFLAGKRVEAGEREWAELSNGHRVVVKYVDAYNASPARGAVLKEPLYNINRAEVYGLLEGVRRARTNDEKKRALEALGEAVLRGVDGFEVFPPQFGRTGEFDRVVRNASSYPILARFGPLIPIECKHWRKPVGTDEVGAFIADLNEAGVQVGMLFSVKGITKPAKDRIRNFYQRSKGFVLVISEQDIRAICDGASLVGMLIEKAETIMLQRKW